MVIGGFPPGLHTRPMRLKNKMKIFTCSPKPFFPAGMDEWIFFSRDMFLQCHAFRQLGHESMIVLLDGPKAQQHKDIIRAKMVQLMDPEWWRQYNLDIVVLGAWAMPEYTPIAKAVKNAGIRLVVRCDSSGRYSQFGRPVWEVLRDNFWSLQERISNPVPRSVATVAKTVLGYSSWAREHKVIEHMSCADLICIESPGARDLVVDMLNRQHRPEIAARVRYLAHPVKVPTSDVLTRKNKQILCIGRWDAYPKNTPLLVGVLVKVLAANADYQVVIAGWGEAVVFAELNRLKCSESVRDRIDILGLTPHDKILELCNQSRINFISSRWESFNIAAAESLCMGCSVVGPGHIATIRNFTSQGYGAASLKYNEVALCQALQSEIDAWRDGNRNPEEISNDWRNEVSALSVGKSMIMSVG